MVGASPRRQNAFHAGDGFGLDGFVSCTQNHAIGPDPLWSKIQGSELES